LTKKNKKNCIFLLSEPVGQPV